MVNLKQRRSTSYRFDSKPEGDIVRLEVYYSKGGMNYANYKTDPRGIYVSLACLKVEHRDGMISESFAVFAAGRRVFVEELQRMSPAKLLAVAERIDADSPALCSLFEQNREVAVSELRAKLLIAQPAV